MRILFQAKFLVLFVILILTSCGESSYEDCILKRMKDAKDKIAAREIRNACYKKHNPYKPPKVEKLEKTREYVIHRDRNEGGSINMDQKIYDRLIKKKSSNAYKTVVKYSNALENWKSTGVKIQSWELTEGARSCRSHGICVERLGLTKNSRQMWLKNRNEYSISFVKISTGTCNGNNPEYTVGHRVYIPPKQSSKIVIDIPASDGSCAWVNVSQSNKMTLDEIRNILYE